MGTKYLELEQHDFRSYKKESEGGQVQSGGIGGINADDREKKKKTFTGGCTSPFPLKLCVSSIRVQHEQRFVVDITWWCVAVSYVVCN